MKQTISPDLAAQLVSDPGKAQCPACNQRGFWDNRENKKNPKAPDYKCKNKNCDVGNGYPCGVYVRDFPAGTTPKANGNGSPRPSVTWKQLQKAYDECVTLAVHEAQKIGKTGTPVDAATIAAMTATLMITRDKVNCWPQQVAPTPPPPPPPPPDGPNEAGDYPDDDLPF